MSSVRIARSPNAQSLAKVARVQHGGLEVAAFFDGYNDLTLDAFTYSEPERFVPLMSAAGLPERPVRVQINSYMIRDEGRVFLVDSGMGYYAGPTMGHAAEARAILGVKPEEVTDIVLTHLHRDHCGGLMTKEETPVFEKATVHVSREEFAYWTDPMIMEASPEVFRPMVRIAQTVMKAYAGRVHLMEPGMRITDRMWMSPIPGHTPGQNAVWFKSGADQLCIWGDIIHCAALQLPLPDITFRYDIDQAQARSRRREMLARAATEGFLVAGAHLPFPGIGTVTATGDGGYRFEALPEK